MFLLWLPKYAVPLDDPCCYPLGFMYVSAILKASGVPVKVCNNNLHSYSIENELEGVKEVWLTGWDSFLKENLNVAKVCRDRGIKTRIGGAIATYTPERVRDHIDYIFTGEWSIFSDLNSEPWPDYEGFGIEEYHRRHPYRYMGILTARGCPYSCTFCRSICKYRTRDLTLVENEIDYYISHHRIEVLVVNDNTLNVSKDRFKAFCKMMLGKGLSWSCAMRLDNVDDEMMSLAKRSGLIYSVVGVESFLQERLDMMNKRLTVEQVERGLELFEKYDIKYHGNILFGFQGETEDDIDREFEIMKQKRYNVMPAYLQNFEGVRAKGVTHRHRNDEFLDYVHSKGYYTYPEAVL